MNYQNQFTLSLKDLQNLIQQFFCSLQESWKIFNKFSRLVQNCWEKLAQNMLQTATNLGLIPICNVISGEWLSCFSESLRETLTSQFGKSV